ncbi:hypothetical protein DSAG12_00251 [Promethearchaeum syntrophicum]|uniref:Uncharacterized protein n=1 Tax=Promethearchaeum syntrophicum TaxID=2594042 RepID=A0A5B9D5N2_9ARCH|nr:hypothetical protein [Candidatus Prometheoarchaeum syntrophicum]QEE14438.1 hypothetical protein DSAG12_00251 [Candidatus Prometheoarchaeum syntrophicum]
MARCPYCDAQVDFEMFFTTKNIPIIGKAHAFNGPKMHLGYKNYAKMWVCPHCDRILGFSEYKWDDD